MNDDSKHLLRYLDREMPADEAEAFRARLAESPALRRELQEMQRVGALVRGWAGVAEERAPELVEPTLARVREAERTRAHRTTLGYAAATALLLLLPWSRQAPDLVSAPPTHVAAPVGAAIERIEVGDQRAQVFMLGGSSTPVVWLADDAPEDDASDQQDPG